MRRWLYAYLGSKTISGISGYMDLKNERDKISHEADSFYREVRFLNDAAGEKLTLLIVQSISKMVAL